MRQNVLMIYINLDINYNIIMMTILKFLSKEINIECTQIWILKLSNENTFSL